MTKGEQDERGKTMPKIKIEPYPFGTRISFDNVLVAVVTATKFKIIEVEIEKDANSYQRCSVFNKDGNLSITAKSDYIQGVDIYKWVSEAQEKVAERTEKLLEDALISLGWTPPKGD